MKMTSKIMMTYKIEMTWKIKMASKIKMTQKWRQPQKWEWDEQRLKRCFGSIPWTWLIWDKNPDFFTTYNVSVSWQFLLSDHCFNPQRRCPGNTEYCQKGANAYNIWYFQNPNSTSTQQQINKSWVWHENDFAYHPTTPPHSNSKYLSCYWPDFDQTLNLSSWDYLELISTVAVTFVQATFVLATFVHIRNISAVTDPILIKFWR